MEICLRIKEGAALWGWLGPCVAGLCSPLDNVVVAACEGAVHGLRLPRLRERGGRFDVVRSRFSVVLVHIGPQCSQIRH